MSHTYRLSPRASLPVGAARSPLPCCCRSDTPHNAPMASGNVAHRLCGAAHCMLSSRQPCRPCHRPFHQAARRTAVRVSTPRLSAVSSVKRGGPPPRDGDCVAVAVTASPYRGLFEQFNPARPGFGPPAVAADVVRRTSRHFQRCSFRNHESPCATQSFPGSPWCVRPRNAASRSTSRAWAG
jgi:hypothetical protein